jgi:hypothetical protein
VTVYTDTRDRGEPERPAYVVRLTYGDLPAQELILDAKTRDEAAAEVLRRFGCVATFT